jgi:hypothetical protein
MKLIKAFRIRDNELCAEEIIHFPSNSPFGHLSNKYAFILTRLNLLNETITDIHLYWEQEFNNRKKKEYTPPEISLKRIALCLRFSSELKMLTDEMISLNYLVVQYSKNKKWPIKIKADCIAKLLTDIESEGFEPFKNNEKVIKQINEIGNAVKHSFVNTDILWLRNLESTPKIFAFYQKDNDTTKDKKFHSIKLPDLIDSFNKLLNEYRENLKNNYS